MNGGAESMNIPNMISMVRILLTPVFAVLYVRGALWQAMGALMNGGIALCAALIGLCLLLYGAKYLRLLRQSEQNNGDAGKSSSRTV